MHLAAGINEAVSKFVDYISIAAICAKQTLVESYFVLLFHSVEISACAYFCWFPKSAWGGWVQWLFFSSWRQITWWHLVLGSIRIGVCRFPLHYWQSFVANIRRFHSEIFKSRCNKYQSVWKSVLKSLEELEVCLSKLAERDIVVQAAPWPGLDPDCVSHVHSRLWTRCNSVPVWHYIETSRWDITVITLGRQGLLSDFAMTAFQVHGCALKRCRLASHTWTPEGWSSTVPSYLLSMCYDLS